MSAAPGIAAEESLQPRISFVIITYNQERFVAEALTAALHQTVAPAEIIVSDDWSTDATLETARACVQKLKSEDRVRICRTPRNLGLAGHINHVMTQISGDIVVVAAGDDVSLPRRVQVIREAFIESGGKALSLYSNAEVIDDEGRAEGLYLRSREKSTVSASYLARGGGVLGSTHAWHRCLFDIFGPLPAAVINEDVAIPFRAALLGEVHYIPEPLVRYRRHGANLHFREARDVRRVSEILSPLRHHAAANVAMYEGRLEDIACVRRLCPGQGVADGLEATTRAMLADMHSERALHAEPSVLRRVGIMARAALRGTPPRRLVRWILTFTLPHLYLVLRRVQGWHALRQRRNSKGSGH